MVEKIVNIEVKTNLQSLSGTRKINSRCLKGHRLSIKKDKNNTNWEHWDGDKDKDKAKSHNLFSANSQSRT